jgi:hypothetical protein
METRGIIFPTTTRAAARIAGVKMAWREFKATPEDILIQVTVHNRGPEAATLHCSRIYGSVVRGRGILP